jgi:hypothetical protein
MWTKYHNKKTTLDGHKFDSIAESERYWELKMLEKAGKIKNLELQKRFPIEHNGVKICSYVADFVYDEDGIQVVEDKKGFKTAIYRLKQKLMKAFYNVEIRES